MHHPDICNIMLIIEDYFLLIDDKDSRCQIQSVVTTDDQDNEILGVKISRKLSNGYMIIDICGEGRDDDTVSFNYKHDLSSHTYGQSIEVECCDYSTDTVRAAVREILILDKQSTK